MSAAEFIGGRTARLVGVAGLVLGTLFAGPFLKPVFAHPCCSVGNFCSVVPDPNKKCVFGLSCQYHQFNEVCIPPI